MHIFELTPRCCFPTFTLLECASFSSLFELYSAICTGRMGELVTWRMSIKFGLEGAGYSLSGVIKGMGKSWGYTVGL